MKPMQNINQANSAIQLEEVLVEATRRMDMDMFKEFAIYVEKYKYLNNLSFVKDLEKVFEKFKRFGDTHLEPNLGLCGRCHKDCYGYLFVGNNSKNYINILFEIKETKMRELTECCEFKAISEVYNLNTRIYIHDYNDPESRDYFRI
jgi:hypothetical protein